MQTLFDGIESLSVGFFGQTCRRKLSPILRPRNNRGKKGSNRGHGVGPRTGFCPKAPKPKPWPLIAPTVPGRITSEMKEGGNDGTLPMAHEKNHTKEPQVIIMPMIKKWQEVLKK